MKTIVKGAAPLRICEFCGAKTNASLRACCEQGRNADKLSASAETTMREVDTVRKDAGPQVERPTTGYLRALQREIHAINIEKGWYESERSFGEFIALGHSEFSEALESYRAGEAPHFSMGKKPEGWGIELADVAIRLLDTAEHYNLDLEELIRIKIEYNKTRPYRHGGKKL